VAAVQDRFQDVRREQGQSQDGATVPLSTFSATAIAPIEV
jgi:hypothetical protein